MEVTQSQIMTFSGFVPVDVINQQGQSMSKPLIIQLLGQARSGKDWTAEQLKLAFEAQGKSVAIMSYAAPMKRITATLFDISLEQLDLYKNNPTEYFIHMDCSSKCTCISTTDFRTFLQRMGNEAMKAEFGNTIWADLMQTQIAKSSVDVVIIPDCRFTVELEQFPQSITIRVLNNDLPAPMQHASELETFEHFTMYVLDNTGYKLDKSTITDLVNIIPTPR